MGCCSGSGAWVHDSSQTTLATGTRVGPGHLVCASLWLVAKIGWCDCVLLSLAVFPVLHGRWKNVIPEREFVHD